MKKEASFYITKNELIVCELCPHNCHLSEGKIGLCGVRQVEDNKLYTLNYGVSSL